MNTVVTELHRPAWLRGMRGLALLVSLAAIGAFAFTVASRIGSPYPVEWQEGTIVNHAFRLLDGLPIYVRPSATFVPVLYPPFGYVVQEWSMMLLGRGLPGPRWVSFLATLCICLIMVRTIYGTTRSRLAALLAVGLFFAAYALCLAWYDQARVDMLYLVLGLASLALLDRRELSWPGVVSAGLLASLSILTKQHGLVMAAAGFGHLIFRSWRHALLFGATVALVVTPTVALLEQASRGWFMVTIWTYASKFPVRSSQIGWALRMMAELIIPLVFAAAWVGVGLRTGEPRRLVSVWTLALAGLSLAAVVSMIHQGGTVNHLIPVLACALIMQGLLIGKLDRAGTRPLVVALLLGIALIPFLIWPWPFRAVPSSSVKAAQAKVVAEIAALPGEVLALEDPYYAWLAGKPMNPDGASIRHLSTLDIDLPQEMVDGLKSGGYPAVVLSYEPDSLRWRTQTGQYLLKLVSENYTYSRSLFPNSPEIHVLRIPRHVYVYKPRTTTGVEN